MTNVNKRLLLSLKQDIKTLNSVSSEILDNLEEFHLRSWLFPTKSFNEIENFIVYIFSESKEYLQHLEVVIDRLYLLIHLFLKYIDSFFAKTQKQVISKNIVRTTTFSIGASSKLLWERMQNFHNLFIKCPMPVNLAGETYQVENTTQTEVYSLSICNSCSLATFCIKEIMEALDINIDSFNLNDVKDSIKKDIYDLTQFGCMNRLTTLIANEIKKVVKKAQLLEAENKRNKSKINDLTTKHQKNLNNINRLEASLEIIKKNSKKLKTGNKKLIKQVNTLTKDNEEQEQTFHKLQEVIQTLEKSLEESSNQVNALTTDNTILKTDLNAITAENEKANSEINLWKDRFSDLYLENKNLKTKLEETKKLNQNLTNLDATCTQISHKLDKCNIGIEKKVTTLNAIAEIVDRRKIKDDGQSYKVIDIVPTFKVKGEPLEDMQKEIEANELTINRLQQYNHDLLAVMLRIQEKQFN